jgi:hypothetical protein
VDLEIGAGASPAVSFLSDKVNVGRAVDRINPETLLGLGDHKRAVLSAFLADFNLLFGHASSF